MTSYNAHVTIMHFFILYTVTAASSHSLFDALDVTSTVLALRTLGTFDFEGEQIY